MQGAPTAGRVAEVGSADFQVCRIASFQTCAVRILENPALCRLGSRRYSRFGNLRYCWATRPVVGAACRSARMRLLPSTATVGVFRHAPAKPPEATPMRQQ